MSESISSWHGMAKRADSLRGCSYLHGWLGIADGRWLSAKFKGISIKCNVLNWSLQNRQVKDVPATYSQTQTASLSPHSNSKEFLIRFICLLYWPPDALFLQTGISLCQASQSGGHGTYVIFKYESSSSKQVGRQFHFANWISSFSTKDSSVDILLLLVMLCLMTIQDIIKRLLYYPLWVCIGEPVLLRLLVVYYIIIPPSSRPRPLIKKRRREMNSPCILLQLNHMWLSSFSISETRLTPIGIHPCP